MHVRLYSWRNSGLHKSTANKEIYSRKWCRGDGKLF